MFGLLLLLFACQPGGAGEVPSAAAERGELRVTVSVPGELEAVKSRFVSAPNVKGTLKVVTLAEEGRHVKQGDVLVEFDRTDLEKERESAQSRLEIAQTKIAQKRAQLAVSLATAQNAVTDAELALRRAQLRVTESETVPRVERESARLDVEQYTLAVARTEANLESTRLAGEAELELLRIDEREASSKLAQIVSQLDQLTVRAPSDGLVVLTESWRAGKHGKVTVGDNLWPGNPILQLPDLAEMKVVAWVHEVDAGLVKAGQPAKVVVDAQPEPARTGVVERVADLAVKRRDDSDVKHVEVTLRLDAQDPTLKPGMTVRAELLVDAVPDVVSVPREAIFHDGTKSYVMRSALGGWRRADIEVGAANDTRVAVTSGLDAGEVVALADPDAAGAPGAVQPAAAAATP
ncbi:MAG: efflux RND transporter periplasmic adaptor subunit [Myxococcota bacterium]